MPIHWKEPDCDCQNWRQSQVLSPLAGDDPFAFVGVVPMFRLCKREIPLLYERKQLFGRCFDRQGESLRLLETGSDIVAEEETAEFIFDAGFHVNAYPRFSFAGGKRARIHITYFEKFGGPWSDRHRSDVQGEITGITDTLTLDGGVLFLEGLVHNLTEVYFQSVLSASFERGCQRTKYYHDDQSFWVGAGKLSFLRILGPKQKPIFRTCSEH